VSDRVVSPDAVARVTGTLPLVQGMSVPNMAHARVIRSPYPHATVSAFDADEARSMPGVIGVWSGADLDAHRDQPILAVRPRYAGDPVAVVVAETEAQAAAAAMAVDIDYEELPYVVDAVAAAQPGAPVVHDDWPDNDCGTTRLRHGDIEEGWRQSDRVYTDVYTSPPARDSCARPAPTASPTWRSTRALATPTRCRPARSAAP
jgi:CO/xanthine dehydrogenase Mo-binding subunit